MTIDERRLERELRDWLAAEAARRDPSDRLRAAVADVRAMARPRGWWPVRHPVLAGIATAGLATMTAIAVIASGILPIGRVDCSGVSVASVRRAVAEVDGYTYRVEGTELMSRLRPLGDGRISFTYETARIVMEGVHRTPADWQIEVIEGWEPNQFPRPSYGFTLISDEFDAYLVVDGAVWVRPRGSDRFARSAGDEEAWTLGYSSSRIADLLAGENVRWSSAGRDHLELPLAWSPVPDGRACRLVAHNPLVEEGSPVSWSLELVVDPDTHLPRAALFEHTIPELIQDGNPTNAFDWHFAYQFDYDEVPELVPPTDPTVPGISEEDALAAAADAGVGPVREAIRLARGTVEAFLVRGSDGVAILVYDLGRQVSISAVPRSEGAHVEIVGNDVDRILVAISNDARVAAVEVTYRDGTSEMVPIGTRGMHLGDATGRGELEAWRVVDDPDLETPPS